MSKVKLQKLLQFLKQKPHCIKQFDQLFTQIITTHLAHPTSTWNSLIRAYSKTSKPIKAILVYTHFTKNPKSHPDNYTYPALLNACSRLFTPFNGQLAHTHILKTGLDHDLYVQNALAHFYGSVGRNVDCFNVFDEMRERDVASWNTLMGVSNNGSSDSLKQIMVLFNGLMHECGGGDKISLVIALSACAQARIDGVECGRVVHGYVIKVGLGCFVNVNNALLDFYIKSKQVDAGSRLFNESCLIRDAVSFTILINGYAEIGCLDKARDVFDRIIDKDLVMWNLMIHAYVKSRRHFDALELFKQMDDNKVLPDENTMVSVLAACAGLSDLKHGRLVNRFINTNNIKQDVFVKTALIDMYSKCGSLEEALVTFYKMVYKDVFTWTTMIEGLANNGYGYQALRMFNQMEEQQIRPNEATFVSVLTACSHSGLINEGCQLSKRMVEVYKLQPKVEHFGCLVDLLSRGGLLHQAEEFIELFQPEKRVVAYKILLSACIRQADVVLGEKVANEIKSLSLESHETHVLLSNFYAAAGHWGQVANARGMMKRLSMSKEPGISTIELKS